MKTYLYWHLPCDAVERQRAAAHMLTCVVQRWRGGRAGRGCKEQENSRKRGEQEIHDEGLGELLASALYSVRSCWVLVCLSDNWCFLNVCHAEALSHFRVFPDLRGHPSGEILSRLNHVLRAQSSWLSTGDSVTRKSLIFINHATSEMTQF